MSQFPTPSVFVINLDERKDRWLAIQKMCRQCGINIERVSAVKRKPGWHGCGLSHVKCATLAKERNLPWVVVLEDDCMFSIEQWTHFKSLLPFLWKNRDKWNYFNGGPTFIHNIELFDKEHKLVRGNSQCAHFIFYTKDVYDKIMEWKPEGAENENACDLWFSRAFKPVSSYPTIAVQTPSFSDLNNKEEDYTTYLNQAETTIHDFLNK
jgi:glycosyl transferase family 25